MLSASSNLSKIDTIALPSARAAERDAGDCSLTYFFPGQHRAASPTRGDGAATTGWSRRRIGVVWLGGASGHEHRYAAQCKVRACPGGQRRSTVPDYACAPSGLSWCLGRPYKGSKCGVLGDGKIMRSQRLDGDRPAFSVSGVGTAGQRHELCQRGSRAADYDLCPGRGSAPPWGRERRAGTLYVEPTRLAGFKRYCASRVLALDRGSRSARKSSLHSPGIRHTTDRRTAERSQRAKRQGLLCLGVTMPPASSTYPKIDTIALPSASARVSRMATPVRAVPDYACAPSGLLALGCPTMARNPACSGTAKSCGANGLMAIVPLFRCGGWGRRDSPTKAASTAESGGLRLVSRPRERPTLGGASEEPGPRSHTSCWFQE